MALGERINQIRREKEMSIDQLSERSGVPKGTLSKITAGITTNPTLDTVIAIARALDCTINDFDDFFLQKAKKAPLYSSEAGKLAHDYDTLDSYGKHVVPLVVDAEKGRCAEQAQSSKVIKIAARDGSFTELCLTDDQIRDLQAYIDQLPDPNDNL